MQFSTLSGLFVGRETAFEGTYSPSNGLWKARSYTVVRLSVCQQQPDGPIVIVGEVKVEISDPGGELDGCSYSCLGEITNRE